MEAAESITRAIEEFLSEGEEQAAATSPASSGFATILFTDMESSTALTQKLGDAAVQEVRRTHNEIVRAALSANSGSEVAELLEVPLPHLRDPGNINTEPVAWRDIMAPPPSYSFGKHLIWGATGRMLGQFLEMTRPD